MICVCVFWWIFFSGIYYRIKIFFQARDRAKRQKKLLKDHRDRSEREQAAVEEHWPWPEAHSHGRPGLDSAQGLHHRRNAKQPPVDPRKDLMSQVSDGPEAREVLVPVMMCCRCTRKSCKRKLKKMATKLRALHQDISFYEADSGCIAVQTQVHLEADTEDKLRGIAAEKFCSEITVQLGRWRAISLGGKQTVTTWCSLRFTTLA